LVIGVFACTVVALIFISAGGLGSLGSTEIILVALVCAPFPIVGVGLLARNAWARTGAIALGAMIVLAFPIVTAVGGDALWVLTKKEAKELFVDGSRANFGETRS
jgi:hypothetical protein